MLAAGTAEVPLLEVLPSAAWDVQVHACLGPSSSWKIHYITLSLKEKRLPSNDGSARLRAMTIEFVW